MLLIYVYTVMKEKNMYYNSIKRVDLHYLRTHQCGFRSMSATHSDRSRPPIPIQGREGQVFFPPASSSTASCPFTSSIVCLLSTGSWLRRGAEVLCGVRSLPLENYSLRQIVTPRRISKFPPTLNTDNANTQLPHH